MDGLKSQITVEELGDATKELSQNIAQRKEMGNMKRAGKKHEEWILKTQYLSNWCLGSKNSENGGETTSKEILAKNSPELKGNCPNSQQYKKATYRYLNGPILHSPMIDLIWGAVKGPLKPSMVEQMDDQTQHLLTMSRK